MKLLIERLKAKKSLTLTIATLSILGLASFSYKTVSGRVAGNTLDEWWLEVATQFSTHSTLYEPSNTPGFQTPFNTITAQEINNIVSPHGPVCGGEPHVQSVSVALSKCGNPKSDIRVTLREGNPEGDAIAESWIDGSDVISIDPTDPTWVDVDFREMVEFEPNLPLYVRLDTDGFNIGDFDSVSKSSVLHGGQEMTLLCSELETGVDHDADGFYRWSIDNSNPYIDGVYEGNVHPALSGHHLADAGLTVRFATVSKVKVIMVAYDPLTPEGRLHDTMAAQGIESPETTARDLEQELENASAGSIDLDIEILYLDKFPTRQVCSDRGQSSQGRCPAGGFPITHTYTVAEFVADYPKLWPPMRYTFAYEEMMAETTDTGDDITTRVNYHRLKPVAWFPTGVG